MRVSPPKNYYITDCEEELRKACKFFEEKGLVGRSIGEFELRYESKELVVSITFERYGESVTVTYFLPRHDDESIDVQRDKGFDVGWTIAKYKNGLYKNTYNSDRTSRIHVVKAYVDFFRDFEDLLLDRKFAENLREKYDVLAVKTID